MSPTPSSSSPTGLQTATDIAEFLKVDARTVHYWAESGKIPTALRDGRVVRFNLDAVLSSLNVNMAGEGRSVELVVLALSLTFGSAFPRISKVDLGSITVDELAEIKRLCAAYAADLDTLGTPEECAAYAEGVLEAARLLARGV